MSLASSDARTLRRGPVPRLGRLMLIALVAVGCLIWAATHSADGSGVTALALGGSLLTLAAGVAIAAGLRMMGARRASQMVAAYLENDAAPSFVADEDGALLSGNPAARLRFQPTLGDTMAGTLRAIFADPSAVLNRLQTRAREKAGAREDIVTRTGPVRLSVQRLRNDLYLWRIEDMPDGANGGRSADTLPVPMLTIGKSGAILFMNDAARSLAGGRVTSLDRLLRDPPLRSGQTNLVLTGEGPKPFRAIVQPITAGRSELFLLPEDGAGMAQPLGLEALPVAIVHLDAQGTVLTANPAAEAMLGAGPSEGLCIDDVMEGLGRPIADWLEETIAQRAAPKSEFLRLTRPDRDRFVQVALGPVRHQGEWRLIAVLTDATELKTLEAQFVQSQKMQAIGQLAGGVAHDFNNLLTAISGHCDLMLLRHDPGDEDFADLNQINQNTNRAAALVGQLLAFSRKQTLQTEVLDVRDTLSDLTHLLNRLVGERLTLTLIHDPVLGAIRADKRQLEQVIMNLVVNARDAMPDGGEIRIETKALHLRDAMQRDRASIPPGEYVTVHVTDQGTGIPPDKLQKVFEPFFTTKRTGEGTGLGLSTAYGIVKQSGGYIFADSTLGEGTTFSLIFPVRERDLSKPMPALAPPQREAPKHGEGVVLLVEDEAPVRAFASRALRLRGYTVIEAESAEAALDTLADRDLSIDVFVTDVVMPGLDGPTWVRQALQDRPDVRVVFVSGYAEGALGDTKPAVPNSVFLQKPFSLTQLTETVHDQINRPALH